MPGGFELQTIPLGGKDFSGNPLPPQGEFYAPSDKAPAAGSSPWEPYAPQAPAGEPGAQGNAGPWEAYAPPQVEGEPKAAPSAMEAIGRGIINAATFGAAPVIAGLSEASGIETPKGPEPEGEPVTIAPGVEPVPTVNPIEAVKGAATEVAKPFIGAFKTIANELSSHPDQAIRDAYNRGREDARKNEKLAQDQHAWAYLAGQLGGSLAMLPATGGMGTAATTLGRIAQGAKAGGIGGGLYGAGETASEGGDLADIAKGGLGGVAAGAALGVVAGSAIEGTAAVGKKVASIVRGARDEESEAGAKVLSALSDDQKIFNRKVNDTEALTAGSEAGTPVYNVDFGGEKTRALLRSAANISPEARNVINEKIASRYQQQADRFSAWIRSKFGGHDKAADIEAIRDLARKQNAPAYRKAYAEGDREIWSQELEQLTAAPYIQRALSKAISKWKNYAVRDGFGAMNPPFRIENGGLIKTGGGMKAFPNIQLWDYAARELQDQARAAPIGSEQAKLYNDLARMLKTELDKEVPSYKAAREGAAAFFKASDAVEAGANFVKDGTISTVQGGRALAKMAPAERELFRRGFAAELANQIERKGYRSDVLNSLFVASPRATQRIRLALGEDGARQFEALMRVEGMINEARLALGNSTTARQSHEAGLAAGAVGLFETLHGALNPVYIIAGGLVLGGRQAARHVDEKMALKVAEMLMSDDPATLAKGYKIVSSSPVIREAFRRASDVGIRQIINYARPSGVGAGALTVLDRVRGAEPHNPSHYPQDYDYGDQGQQQGAGAVH